MIKAFNSSVKQQQLITFSVIALIIIVGLSLSLWFLGKKYTPDETSDTAVTAFDLASPLNQVNGSALRNQQTKKNLQAQQALNTELNQRLESLEQNEKKVVEQLLDLEIENSQLKLIMNEVEASEPEVTWQAPENIFPGITQVTVNLTSNVPPEKEAAQKLGQYVPANSYVKGIVISGADTSTGVFSRADPSPILIRLIDEISLPNREVVDLIDCRVSLASFGKISSSRSIARSERLSCVHPNGEILDISIKAYLTGPDGKEGVRGQTVHRQMPVIKNAMLAGMISGLSDIAKASLTTTAISPYGVNQAVQGADVLGYSAASGVSEGSEKVADYLMRLAEQYEPIVELHAGTPVEVVFIEGFYLKDQSIDPAQQHTSQIEPYSSFNSTTSSPNQNNRIVDQMAAISLENSQPWLQEY